MDIKAIDRTLWRAIVGLGITQIIGWGSTFYLLTILARPISADLDLSPEVAAGGMSVLMIVSAVLGPFAGQMMDLHGAKRVLAVGSIIAAAGLILLSQATGMASYALAWFVIGASNAMILYPAAFTALTQIAPDKARHSITMLTLPGGLASTVFWPLTSQLLDVMSWRGICVCYAALQIAVCLPIHLFGLPAGGGKNRLPDHAKKIVPGLPHAARARAFVLFSAVLALNALLFTGVLNQFTTFMGSLGYGTEVVLACSMLFGIAQVSARLVEMIFGGNYDPLRGTVAFTFGTVVAMALLGVGSPLPAAAVAFAVLFGACGGLLTISRGTLVVVLFGSEGYGQMSGKLAVAYGIAGAAAPVVLSNIIARAGANYALIFCLCVAAAMFIAMLALFRHATRPNSVS